MTESEVHLLVDDTNVRSRIQEILNINESQFVHEDEYINKITADFTVVSNNKIRAIIECKGGNIGVTDYVRGIGQIFQYEYFYEKRVPHRSLPYEENFNTVYLFPDSVLRNNLFNVGRFKYPKTVLIVEVNERNNALRLISKKELTELEEAEDDNLVSISQYYFRDNRIFELYILMKYLLYLETRDIEETNRKVLEERFLRKIGTINNRNWRNAFITLSNLGLINDKNRLTVTGKDLVIHSYEEFAYRIYESYISTYFEEIYKVLSNGYNNESNARIVEKIRENYNGRDVLYLTQSNGRYISSWLNIMRDDYGCLNFETRNSNRSIIYNPSELNKETFKNKIRENSVAYTYIERFNNLTREGIY